MHDTDTLRQDETGARRALAFITAAAALIAALLATETRAQPDDAGSAKAEAWAAVEAEFGAAPDPAWERAIEAARAAMDPERAEAWAAVEAEFGAAVEAARAAYEARAASSPASAAYAAAIEAARAAYAWQAALETAWTAREEAERAARDAADAAFEAEIGAASEAGRAAIEAANAAYEAAPDRAAYDAAMEAGRAAYDAAAETALETARAAREAASEAGWAAYAPPIEAASETLRAASAAATAPEQAARVAALVAVGAAAAGLDVELGMKAQGCAGEAAETMATVVQEFPDHHKHTMEMLLTELREFQGNPTRLILAAGWSEREAVLWQCGAADEGPSLLRALRRGNFEFADNYMAAAKAQMQLRSLR